MSERRHKTITYQGETRSAQEWSLRLGGHTRLVVRRIHAGWPVVDAITTPIGTLWNHHSKLGRAQIVVSELEWILPCTAEAACARLGYTKLKSLKELLRRQGRSDLIRQLKGAEL